MSRFVCNIFTVLSAFSLQASQMSSEWKQCFMYICTLNNVVDISAILISPFKCCWHLCAVCTSPQSLPCKSFSDTLLGLLSCRISFCDCLWALLFNMLLQQCTQVARVVLQEQGGAGGQHCQPADQLTLDHSHWWQFGIVYNALYTQQFVVDAGSCWDKCGT